MGGGAVLRGISRVFGGGAATAGGRVGLGHGSPVQQVAAPISSAKPTISSAPLTSSSSSCSSEQGFDDWEFPSEEGGIQTHHQYAHPYHVDRDPNVRHRLIFGTVPTPQEVTEATSDLRDYLNLAINPASSTLGHGTVSPSFSPVNHKLDSVEVSNIHEIDGKSDGNLVNHLEQEIDENKDKVLQKSGHSCVVQAFSLLQENPAVQGMVFSLASDEAVWNAVMNNEKVKEFSQSLVKGEPEYSQTYEDAYNCSHDQKNHFPTDENEKNRFHGQKSRFFEAMEHMKAKVFEYMEKITEFCSQFFGSNADKVFSEKDGEFVRALKASSMLCIVVLLIIILKRV